MRKFLFTTFLLTLSIDIFCQNFFGIVLQSDDGQPIPGVSIKYLTTNTITDQNGMFQLNLESEKEEITIQAFGYATQKLWVSPGGTEKEPKKFYLSPDNELLDIVVVSVGKHEQRIEQTTVSLEVIPPYIGENKNILDIKGVVNQTPGVAITDRQANIRSGSGWTYGAGTRVLVLVDDIPLISADANQVQWTLIPFEALSQMEVIKGSASSLYGSSALNGVINVRSKAPTLKPTFHAKMFYGLYDNPSRSENKWWEENQWIRGADFSYSDSKENFGWVISGDLLNNEGYYFDGHENRARIFSKGVYSLLNNKLQISLGGGLMYSESGDALMWQDYDQAYIPLDSNATIAKGWDYHIDPKVVFSQGKSKHSLKGRFLKVNNDARSQTNNFENYSSWNYGEYQWQYFPIPKLTLTSGMVGSFGKSESEIFSGVYRTQNAAVYTQADFKWNRLSLSGGARYEYFAVEDVSYQKPVFRLGVNYQIGASTFLRANYGEGFRFPSIAELFTQTIVGALTIVPNPELKPEEGYSAELGVKQGFRIKNFKGFFDLAGFYMRFNNMMEFSFGQWIDPNDGGLFGNVFKSMNIGNTQIAGIELSVSGLGKLGDFTLKGIAGYTYANPIHLSPEAPFAQNFFGNDVNYQSSSSDGKGNTLKYRYQHLAKTDLEISTNRWALGGSLQMHSFMENIDLVFNQFINGVAESREANMQPVFLLDSRISYQLNENLKFGFIVNNLLNVEDYSRPAVLGPPRNFLLQIDYRF